MLNTKDFNKLYMINNTFWKNKLNLDNIKRFKTIKYGDNIILHFGVQQSLNKIMVKIGSKFNPTLFISIINACLRIYEIIKKVYPYNKIYVILHLSKNNYLNSRFTDISMYKSVIDIIPNFAVINSYDELDYFDSVSYKHIFYCMDFSDLKTLFHISEIQIWKNLNGSLYII